MNFSHLYSSALDQELGTNDSTQLFTEARRKRAINTAQLHWCDLTECAIKQSTISCDNGRREYNLLNSTVIGSDFLRISAQMPEYQLISSGSSASTTFIAGPDLFPRREIPWLNQYDPGWRSSTGSTPDGWYTRADGGQFIFGFVTPPSITSSQSGKLILPYVAKPSSLVNDTSIPFTFGSTFREDLEPYHQALVHYAASELEKLRLNTEGSQMQMQLFTGYLERFLRMKTPKGGQQIRFARNAFNDVRSKRIGWGRIAVDASNFRG